MFDKIGDAICNAFTVLFVVVAISVPLALWKVYDIVVYIFEHVDIKVQ